ncbi:hypothetical protein [Erythrobacter crassostreae]|uniref:Uncharacterized protein n=1 Tax=Erythrobacter crassostreae TaxID=2828328 RepID=A0A9X1F255_9SPHN|nr:hypothetical protein [Erythrobacter crassostrea]MBV7257958.1 hypothetical protein [Erythrobacter crassostrea]
MPVKVKNPLGSSPKIGSTPENVQPSEINSSGSKELERKFRSEVGMLSVLIDSSWGSKADNDRIDREVTAYKERAERFADGRFGALSEVQRNQADGELRAFYDTQAETAEREAAWAEQMVNNIGVADAAYNLMLVHATNLDAAVVIYPENATYSEARALIGGVLQKFGSREGANILKEEVIMERARKVRMPAAVQASKPTENLFRTAWGTSGIPYTIKKIHIRSGWAPKRNAYGIVIGQVRDAAIAVEDPASGKCYLYDFTMIKEGSAVRRSSHAAKRMACENIPK